MGYNNKKYYGRTAFAENRHERWTPEEIQMVLNHDISDHELAYKLGRSVMSIQCKRHFLKNKEENSRGKETCSRITTAS